MDKLKELLHRMISATEHLVSADLAGELHALADEVTGKSTPDPAPAPGAASGATTDTAAPSAPKA